MLLFFEADTLGYLELEVTIFRHYPRIYKAPKACCFKPFSPKFGREETSPKHPLRDVILKRAWDKIHSEVLKRCCLHYVFYHRY